MSDLDKKLSQLDPLVGDIPDEALVLITIVGNPSQSLRTDFGQIRGQILAQALPSVDAADDVAAAAAGVAVGRTYHNAGAVRVRLS